MDKIIKLNSRQGGPFTQQQNLCDFDIPADGTYDLSNSYINVFARISGTSGGTNYPNLPSNDQRTSTLANVAVNWKDSPARSFYNIAMVKNCSLSTEQAGVLEDIRRVDILKQNLNEYAMSTDQKESLDYTRLSGRTDQSGERSSIFSLLFKEGSQTSQIIPGRIQIPMSQLFELGKMKEYPATNLGKSRIHLEMNLDKFMVVDATDQDQRETLQKFATITNGSSSVTLPCTWTSLSPYSRKEDSCFYVGQKVSIKYTSSHAIAAANAAIFAAQGVTAGSQFLTLKTTAAGDTNRTVVIHSSDDMTGVTFKITGFENLAGAESTVNLVGAGAGGSATTTQTFYKVTGVQATVAGATNCSVGWGVTATPIYYKEKTIASISYGNDMKQTLTFDFNAPPVPTNSAYSGITVTPMKTQNAGTLNFESAELVLRKLNQNVKAPSELNYLTWSTEQFTANNEKDFQRMFQLEPEAVNVFMTFPDHDLFSRNGDLKSFRLRLDGEDLVDRDILVDEENSRDPLYYDRLSMTMLNSMIPLNSLSEQNESVARYDPSFNPRFNGDEVLFQQQTGLGATGNIGLDLQLDGRQLFLSVPQVDDGQEYTIYGVLQDGSTVISTEKITLNGTDKIYSSALRYKRVTQLSLTTYSGSTTKPITLHAKPYKLVTISSPVPQTPMEKLLQVNFDLSATAANPSPAGLKQMNLYKHVMRQVKP